MKTDSEQVRQNLYNLIKVKSLVSEQIDITYSSNEVLQLKDRRTSNVALFLFIRLWVQRCKNHLSEIGLKSSLTAIARLQSLLLKLDLCIERNLENKIPKGKISNKFWSSLPLSGHVHWQQEFLQ